MIIIDEFHLLSDANRGYIIEHIVSKILYSNFKNLSKIRIIGLSATLPNIETVSDWFHGINYVCTVRPIKINEYVVENGNVTTLENEIIRTFNTQNIDEILMELCVEGINNKKSLLVFCSARQKCENYCNMMVKYLEKKGIGGKANNDIIIVYLYFYFFIFIFFLLLLL